VASLNVRSRLTPLRHTSYRLLFIAWFGSAIGNWLATVALSLDVYDRTHSALWVGELLLANLLPSVFIGLLLGPLVDRLSRKRLMIGADLVRLAVFVALPFANSAGGIVLLAFVAGIGAGFFRPAVLAGIPNLVDEDELPAANALIQIVDAIATALGPLLGGLLVAASGPNLAYYVNAVTFAFSAALIAFIPGRLLQSDRPISRGRWSDLAEGFGAVKHSRALSCVLIVWSGVMIAGGIVNVAEVFLAKDSLSSGDFGFGLLWAGSGVGLVIGGFAAAPLVERDIGTAYVRFVAVFTVGIACAAVAPNVWVAAAAMALSGFGNGGGLVANVTLVQRGAPDRVRGRVFTVLISANFAVLGLAFIAAGPLTNAYGARWAFGVAACAAAVSTLGALRYTRGIELDLSPAAPHGA
jgi:MFS family permease